MELVSGKWLLFLGCAAAWTIFFSMFSARRVRGWRNLGWLACFSLGIAMVFGLPWRSALATWSVAVIFSGLLYFSYELFAFVHTADKSEALRPNPITVVHGLIMWPIILPEAVEYFLTDAGVLKAAEAPTKNGGA